MSNGMTIADFVQQVYYAIYKVRLDVGKSNDENSPYHSKSDKFKEVVMEANFVLQELQSNSDWNWLRKRWNMGFAHNHEGGIQEFELPDDAYKPCTGYGDAIRLSIGPHRMQVPWTSPRMGNRTYSMMFGPDGDSEHYDNSQQAFQVGRTITFKRHWHPHEIGGLLETDYIRLIDPLHICDDKCDDNCKMSYEDKVFTEIPDPYYMVVRTAAKRAEGDPSVSDRVQSLSDEAAKIMSAMRENDSAHTIPDSYDSAVLGYIGVF